MARYSSAGLLSVAKSLLTNSSHTAPYWVVYAGDSRTRGLFLATLDRLLPHARANLTTTAFFKCWGIIDVVVDNVLRITWRDVRPRSKDLTRVNGSVHLPVVRDDFRRFLRTDNASRGVNGGGVYADVLIMEYGFDITPEDFTGKRIQLTGWDYWKDNRVRSSLDWEEDETVYKPLPGWQFVDTRSITRHQLDRMCDEGTTERKHFHAACGRFLCGDINSGVNDVVLTAAFGAPPPGLGDDAFVVDRVFTRTEERDAAELAAANAATDPPFRVCHQCRLGFTTSYTVHFNQPRRCEVNQLSSHSPASTRRFCVAAHATLDASVQPLRADDERLSITGRRVAASQLAETRDDAASRQQHIAQRDWRRAQDKHVEKIAKVSEFSAARPAADEAQAKVCLSRTLWNVTAAVAAYDANARCPIRIKPAITV